MVERLKQRSPETFLYNYIIERLKQEFPEAFLHNHMVKKLKQEPLETFLYNYMVEKLKQEFPETFIYNHIDEILEPGSIYEMVDQDFNVDASVIRIPNCFQNASQNQILSAKQATFSQHTTNSPTAWLEKAIFENHINYYDYNEFINLEKINEGRFGNVYKAEWSECGIAVALKSLKANIPKIVEEHIKNILVHEDRMLIADFGLSIYDTENFIDYGIYGMPAFIDPQALKEFSYKFTKKSDIYGLGVIFWEISSGYRPFKTMTDIEIIFNVQQGNRETPIKNTPLRFVKLYELCWDETPEIRPEANTILEDLNLCTSDEVL
ncbi:kinase-like protein [Gigaspora margarita]|uniref:Kinase-like protein n=1 Tax=Gigaspora margarita TaxID=4874 RepID=A0A8H4AKT9_GIGMA|nr:kinase-like protein [Gigaspora margarita]